ncbi:photosystem II protein Y [Nostoc sp. FACHB-152]|jgi:photosystem II PsbY protein|nr:MULTISPECIES: photosystem II protein Y [unclassified Nostoc]MBD2448740.1 photosystem II protein Y [Nostoc sp. FACHB-152]MBD2470173.1 photosystem II protein Y [Nostoc sp. FACHB-145]
MDNIDFRVVIVLAPIAVAAGWALFNIGAAALRQVQTFLNREA